MILLASIVLWIAYLLCAMTGYGKYANAQMDDPLAMVDALFPCLNFISLSISILGFVCIVYKIENRYLHVLILTQFSLILWVTPFYLSGFVVSHDTLYHGGVSSYAPDVLRGGHTYFSGYLENYPMSFVFNWIFMNIIAADVPTYGRVVFPTAISVATAILMYNFVTKLLNSRVAFASTLLTIPALYAVEIQVSPQSIAVILVLTIVSLLYRSDAKSKMLSVLALLVLVVTHPLHPLLLAMLLVAPGIVEWLTHVRSGVHFSFYVLLLGVAWVAWALFNSTAMSFVPLLEGIYHVITFRFAVYPGEAVYPSRTLFPLFGFLRTYILFSYAAVAFGCGLAYLNLRRIGNTRAMYKGLISALGPKRLMLITSILVFLFLTFVLRTSVYEGGINLAQRSIFYLFLSLCIFIASTFDEVIHKPVSLGRKALLLVLICSWVAGIAYIYPLASYYDAGYSAIPYSEGVGIEFLRHIPSDSAIFTWTLNDLALTSRAPRLELVWLPQDRSRLPQDLQQEVENIDAAIFQRGSYYYSINQDLSFQDNAYTRMHQAVSQSTTMNRVYSNPSYEIFVKA